MNLILIARAEITNDLAVLRDGRATHLLAVLKVTVGQPVRIGVLDEGTGVGLVTAVAAGEVTLQCRVTGTPARPPVDLLLALPRPKVMKRLWAQLAALGVGQIILTNAARVERSYFDTHLLEPAGYRPLLIEGLQQARDSLIPAISIHRQFRILVEDHLDTLFPAGRRVVAHPDAAMTIGAATAGAGGSGRVLVAVGPEGGWNEFELALLERHRFHRVAIGPRTLRTDTACVALLALVHDALRTSSEPR